MTTTTAICLIIVVLSFIAGIILFLKQKEEACYVALFIMILAFITGTVSDEKRQSYLPKEFPSSDYTFSYKVTEMNGVRDTTYVITKIKK